MFVFLETATGIAIIAPITIIPSVIPNGLLIWPPARSSPLGGSGMLVAVTASVNTSNVACDGPVGAELSLFRTLLIWPGFTITHVPAELQSFTNPSKTTRFIWPELWS